jgi:hypothetical protein
MPPARSKKYQERLDLAVEIKSHGIEMSPCLLCEKT